MELARFSLRLFVEIRRKTKILTNINMWQRQTALECVLSVGVFERTVYEKGFRTARAHSNSVHFLDSVFTMFEETLLNIPSI